MAEDKNVIGILFGVKGGGDINGSSGKRIKKELNLIANAISLSVGVTLKDGVGKDIQNRLDKISEKVKIPIEIDFDGKKLDDIEKRLEEVTKKKATIKIDIDEGAKRATGANSRGSSNTTGATDGKKVINDFYRSARALVSFLPRTGKEFEVLRRQAEGLAIAARDVVEKNPSLRGLLEEKIDDVKRQQERYDARRTDRSEAATKSDFEAKIKKAMQLERQLASVTDETSLKFKRLKEEAEAAWEGVYAEWGKRGVTFQDGGALIQKDSEENEKFRAMLRQRESIRKEGEKLRQDKTVEKKLKEWIKLERQVAEAAALGAENQNELKEAAEAAATAAKEAVGGDVNNERYKKAETEVTLIRARKNAKANKGGTDGQTDPKLELRWERIVAGVNSLNERYIDLINTSGKARTEIDKLYTVIRKGQLKVGDKIGVNSDGTPIEATSHDVSNQVTEFETLYKKVAGNMSDLEAKTHTLGNKIKETFNSKMLQTFAYALVGFISGALRKVYTNVVELDKAVTDLQIATGKTREETTALVESYADLAKQLGATLTEVTDGADTWLRQGYDIAETTQLITDSMMLSKLGQLESAEASKALTSALKGYKLEVADATRVVDKFTAVDMQAAVSAGDIATAMAETAASADVAGVSMDRLIGYISTVSEVTQDGAESVGNFYKTLFARMGNVKTGKFIDDETGERLNDVEGTLGALGIELRSSNDTFRDFGEVLDEVGAKWDSFTNVQQHAIATAFAGTRQQEKFIVLMENYAQAMEYANVSANSEGTATSKYNAAYLDSIEAKVNELTAAWQSFSMNLLDSDLVKGLVDALSTVVGWLDSIVSFGEGKLIPFLIGIPVALAAMIKSFRAVRREASITAAATASSAEQAAEDVKKAAETAATTSAAPSPTNPANTEIIESAAEANEEIAEGVANTSREIAETNGDLIEGTVQTTTGKLDELNKKAGSGVESFGKKVGTALKQFGQQIVAAIPALVTTLLAFVSSFEGGEAKIATAVLGIAAVVGMAISMINKSVRGFMKSNPLGWILSAVSAVVMAVTAIIDLIPTYDKAKEKAEEAVTAWKEQKSQLEETTDKIAELRAELEKLEELDNPSIVDEAEISRLNQEIDLLQAKKALQEQEELKTRNEAVNASKDAWDQYIDDKNLEGDEKLFFSRINWTFSNWGSATEEAKEEAVSTLTEMGELFGEFSYGYSNYVDSMLDKYYFFLDKHTIATKGATEALENIYSRSKFKEGADELNAWLLGLADSTKITKEAIEELLEDTEGTKKVDELLAYLQDVGIWDGGNYDPLIEYFKDLRFELTALSAIDLATDIEAVSTKFDGLNNALKEVKENGVLGLETIKALMEDAPLVLENYFDRTNEGYKLKEAFEGQSATSVLSDMAKEELTEYGDRLNKAKEELDKYTKGSEEYEQQLKNLAIAQDDYNTKLLEWNVLLRDPAIEDMTEQLETQQDALETQLDTYKSLVDIRKDIIETYKEEQDYRRELDKKQQNVSTLRARLAAASLDNSAEGQARQRELSSELATAQEELDTYTLEHAIQDITLSMDNEYAEYEAYIKEQVNIIADKLDNISSLIKLSLDTQNLAIEMSGSASEYVDLANKMKEMGITSDEARGANGAVTSNSQFLDAVEKGDWKAASSYYSQAKQYVNDNYKNDAGGNDGEETEAYSDFTSGLMTIPYASGEGIAKGTSGNDGDNGIITYNSAEYEIEAGEEDPGLLQQAIDAGALKDLVGEDKGIIGDRDIFLKNGVLYGYLNGKFIKLRGRWSKRKNKSSPADNEDYGYTGFMRDAKPQKYITQVALSAI